MHCQIFIANGYKHDCELVVGGGGGGREGGHGGGGLGGGVA